MNIYNKNNKMASQDCKTSFYNTIESPDTSLECLQSFGKIVDENGWSSEWKEIFADLTRMCIKFNNSPLRSEFIEELRAINANKQQFYSLELGQILGDLNDLEDTVRDEGWTSKNQALFHTIGGKQKGIREPHHLHEKVVDKLTSLVRNLRDSGNLSSASKVVADIILKMIDNEDKY